MGERERRSKQGRDKTFRAGETGEGTEAKTTEVRWDETNV